MSETQFRPGHYLAFDQQQKPCAVKWLEIEGQQRPDYARAFSAINELFQWYNFAKSYPGLSRSHIRKLWKQRLQSNG